MLSRWKNQIEPYRVLMVVFAFSVSLVGCPQMTDTANGPDGGENNGSNPSSQVLAMEDNAHTDINTERTSRSLSALPMTEALRLVARAHSEDMAARDFFAHTNPDGDDPFERMGNANISFQTAGENIFWNNFPDPVGTAVDGWMKSDGHRANILEEGFTHTGMGVAGDPVAGYYFTQVFTGGGKKSTEFVYGYLPPATAVAME